MKEENLHLFKKLNVHLSMSLPGYTTFKEHTGVDNVKGVLTWFRKAKEIGLQTTVNVTVTQKNYFELFETVSVGLINGASDVLLNRFLPGGRGLEYMDSLTLNKEQLNGMLDTTEEVLSLSMRRGHVGTEFPHCIINSPSKYERLSIGTQCAAAKQFFVVGPSGEIRACNHSPRIVGNIFAPEIITDVEYWNDFAEFNYKPEPCKSCEIVEFCDCGCREVANILLGSHKEVDPCIKGK